MERIYKNILELQLQGIIKNKIIAHMLGVGERTIQKHVSTMLESGMIKIVAVPNPVLCGFMGWARVGLKIEPSRISHVARILIDHPATYLVVYALGRYDIIISVYFETIHKLDYFINYELKRIKGIIDIETSIFSAPRKFIPFSWPAPIFHRTNENWDTYQEYRLNTNLYKIDKLDINIINILKSNGLTRPKTIATKLNVGVSLVRRRMKLMSVNDIYRVEVVPNPEILEYEERATIGIQIYNKNVHDVLDSIIKNPIVFLASATIGRFNAIIACRFVSIDELYQFVITELPAIPGIVSTETFLHDKPLKYDFVRWPKLLRKPTITNIKQV